MGLLNLGFKGLEDARRCFHESHSRLYGYSMSSEDVEIVNIRLRVIASRVKPEPKKAKVEAKGKPVEYREVLFEEGKEKTPVFRREDLPAYFEHEGAAIIEGKDSTTVVPPDMSFFFGGSVWGCSYCNNFLKRENHANLNGIKALIRN